MFFWFAEFPTYRCCHQAGEPSVMAMRAAMYETQEKATSHDGPPNGGLVRELPLFEGNLGW